MQSQKLLITLILVSGCAGTRVAIEKPIAERCETTGLKSCRDVTEGIVLYVEGDQRRARQKLHLALDVNGPDEWLEFAGTLRTVPQIPGAGDIAARMQQVIELLVAQAQRAEAASPPDWVASAALAAQSSKEKRSGDSDADPPSPKSKAPISAAGWRPSPSDVDGKTVVPASEEGNRACALTGIMSSGAESSKGFCVRVSRGPLVVTDLHSSSACPAELFALAGPPGDLSAPRWAVHAQPASNINVSGGSLVVRENEHFIIGVTSTSEQKIKRDVRCSITWSGWRPPATKESPRSDE